MTAHDLQEEFDRVEFADSMWSRIKGLMFKDVSEGDVLVHSWDRTRDRTAHMIGAKKAAHCYWLIDGEIVAHEWLLPWSGSATHEGDTLIQVIGDSDLEVGDRVRI